MAQNNKHALVFGASGISGNELCNELLIYPSKDTFARITGLTNRPLSIRDAGLPNDPRLKLISGIDLTDSLEAVKQGLKDRVSDIKEVTHVFFMAYIQKSDHESLREANVQLLQTAIEAVDSLSPNLQHVILQTGGKAYGVEFRDKINVSPPFKESLPRIEEPYGSKIFYYAQVDTLAAFAVGKRWKWTEVRPDVIVGFVPTSNAMNCAGPLAYYLSLYRHVHGKGATVPFPGSQTAWNAKYTDTSAYVLSHFEIFAALHPEKTASKAFNIANGDIKSWSKTWGGIVSYFGLVAGEPTPSSIEPEEFFKSHQAEWDELVKQNGLIRREETSWWFMQGCLTREFDRQFDLTAAREAGFTEKVDTVERYAKVFDKMREARFIP